MPHTPCPRARSTTPAANGHGVELDLAPRIDRARDRPERHSPDEEHSVTTSPTRRDVARRTSVWPPGAKPSRSAVIWIGADAMNTGHGPAGCHRSPHPAAQNQRGSRGKVVPASRGGVTPRTAPESP